MLESDLFRRSGSKLTIVLGQDDSRRAVRRRPGDDAAPARRRLHGHRQVGGDQQHAHEHALPRDARRGAADPDRSQAPRTRDVRGDSAPADAGRRRSQAGGQRAGVGRARDGGALQDAGGRGRAQHRPVQPQHPPGDRAEARAGGGRGVQDPPLHRHPHRRARRPDDGGQQRGRGVDRAPRADGARGRHPPDPRDPAAVGGRRHRPDQGEPAGAHLVPADVEGRLAHDPRRQRRRAAARARATCSTCRPPRRG